MSPRTRRTSQIIIARSKRTGEKYVTRTSGLSGYHGDRGLYLHYTDSTRLEMCRCAVPQSHEKSYPLNDVDTNLAIAVKRYMEKFDLESCHQSDFYRYRERQKIDWALRSVHAERFHYISKEKNIVCRCNSSGHLTCRRVHNPEIQELCAEFFLLEATEIMCTRDEWQATEGRATTPKNPRISRTDSFELVSKQCRSNEGFVKYDNASDVEPLQVREARSSKARRHRSDPSVGRNANDFSYKEEDMAFLRNGPNGEVDVPEHVWRVSRPSVYLGQDQFEESLMSTPIGTAATPLQQEGFHIDPMSPKRRPSTLVLGATAPGVDQYADAYSNVAQGRCVHSTTKHPNPHQSGFSQGGSNYDNTECDIAGLQVNFTGTPQYPTSDSLTSPTHVAELPSLELAIELESPSIQYSVMTRRTPSTAEVEAAGRKHVAELNGRASGAPSKMSEGEFSSRRITCLIDQSWADAKLPCQEDFFLQWVEVCSSRHPAPLGDCSVCQNCLHAPNKSTIRLTCGHFVHYECLVTNFRVQDFEYGNCPVCGMALCERTLHDRVDTDREAIFGLSFTSLKIEERIDFAQRGEIVLCCSEEEVAAAQLRLLKDYIDAHADELYRQWQRTGLECDWHTAVVTPVVQLFKGWNVPTRKCRYFADRDAFYELVVWAELVRLMNTIRVGVKTLYGEDAPFPQLNELQRNFMMAKERYEKEKKTWPTNRSGVLMCEKVAQDAFSMAVGTHLGTHP